MTVTKKFQQFKSANKAGVCKPSFAEEKTSQPSDSGF